MTGRHRLGCILTALPTLLFITSIILFGVLVSPIWFVVMIVSGVTIVGQSLRWRIKNPPAPRPVSRSNVVHYCSNCRRRVNLAATFCPHCKVRLFGVQQLPARQLGWRRYRS